MKLIYLYNYFYVTMMYYIYKFIIILISFNYITIKKYNDICYSTIFISIYTANSPLCDFLLKLHMYGIFVYQNLIYILLTFFILSIQNLFKLIFNL